jgi:hypothetical protein
MTSSTRRSLRSKWSKPRSNGLLSVKKLRSFEACCLLPECIPAREGRGGLFFRWRAASGHCVLCNRDCLISTASCYISAMWRKSFALGNEPHGFNGSEKVSGNRCRCGRRLRGPHGITGASPGASRTRSAGARNFRFTIVLHQAHRSLLRIDSEDSNIGQGAMVNPALLATVAMCML